jgi:DNA topoisomerase-2
LEAPQLKANVKANIIANIMKWEIMHNVEDIIKAKEMLVLKKTERKKKTVKIEGLDPANNAGGKYSSECSLFVCEGLSAKTYVVAGIGTGVYGKSGRDWFGVLPVTGKILNVRNATSTSIASNKVISSFIQTTGLKYDVDYTIDENFRNLYYGKVIIITDADVDGIHIESLLMNLIHNLFPTLLERSEPYLVSMKTPIARVFLSKTKNKLFYDEIKFNEFIKSQDKCPEVKYYKGLGTTKEQDVPDTFGSKMVEYYSDQNLQTTMNKIFHKDYADKRKEWLGEFNPNLSVNSLDDMKNSINSMNISDYLNNETIKFSHSDCCRSIPNCIDGLKESQRKILYAVIKKGLKFTGKSCKVAQLSGYTAEHSNYHHGEQNLQDTMINMAANYVGVNNIPLLYPDGGFGTRLEGGKDAASARYIYTKMEGLTDIIFSKKDEPILNYVVDDGDLVQPEFYVPIIPMILVNGCVAGIGTGWSCNVPCYNPVDIVTCIKQWLNGDNMDVIHPWYRDFKGKISKENNKYVTEGVIENTKNQNVKNITELPIGMWTNKFKELTEDLVCSKQIKSCKNYSTTTEVNFLISEHKDGIKSNFKNLNMYSYLYITNMVLFDDNCKIKKYEDVSSIIVNFCEVRLEYYEKRKAYELKVIDKEITDLNNKQRFITSVVDETIEIMRRKENDILGELESEGYINCQDLLRLSVKNFTKEKIEELEETIKNLTNQFECLKSKTAKDIWNEELDIFSEKYESWLVELDKRKKKK